MTHQAQPREAERSGQTITDAYMRERLATAATYALVVLRPTATYYEEGSRAVVWEHGRRNMALEAAGTMPLVCPVGDQEIAGVCILNLTCEEARTLMDDDPGVRAGIFTVEVHACRGFPGSCLP